MSFYDHWKTTEPDPFRYDEPPQQEKCMAETAFCQVCGEPMPEGEEMFNYHGHSGPCPKPPLPTSAPPKAEFVDQVALIRQTDDGLLEVQDMGDGTFNLIVHSRHGETDRFDDLSIRLEPKHFAMLGSIAKAEGK
jgi:hypothetical protein